MLLSMYLLEIHPHQQLQIEKYFLQRIELGQIFYIFKILKTFYIPVSVNQSSCPFISNKGVCVCVHTYIYKYIYIHIYAYISIHTCIFIYKYKQIYTHAYINIYKYAHTYIYINICMSIYRHTLYIYIL